MTTVYHRTFVWSRNDSSAQTLETFSFQSNGNILHGKGQISGVLANSPISIIYQVELDLNWKVLALSINSLLESQKQIQLSSDSNGNWFDHKGNQIPGLEGCLDIDISLTPFTNTIPVKRLGDALTTRTSLKVLYLDLYKWEYRQVSQFYTKLSEKKYLYEGVFRDFRAILELDDEGFAIHYPTLFQRIYPIL